MRRSATETRELSKNLPRLVGVADGARNLEHAGPFFVRNNPIVRKEYRSNKYIAIKHWYSELVHDGRVYKGVGCSGTVLSHGYISLLFC